MKREKEMQMDAMTLVAGTNIPQRYYDVTDARAAKRAGGFYNGTVDGIAWVHYPKGIPQDAHRAHLTRVNFEKRMWDAEAAREAREQARKDREAALEAIRTAPLAHAREGERCLYRGATTYSGVITKVHGKWVTVKFQLRYQKRTGEFTERRVNPWAVEVQRRGHWTALHECDGHDAAQPRDY